MQSLFEPVISEIIGLVSQQVREAKEKKGAVINARIHSSISKKGPNRRSGSSLWEDLVTQHTSTKCSKNGVCRMGTSALCARNIRVSFYFQAVSVIPTKYNIIDNLLWSAVRLFVDSRASRLA